MLTLMSVQSAL